jgi:hypothetical protein
VLNRAHTQGSYAPFFLCARWVDSTDRYVSRSFECENSGNVLQALGVVPTSLPVAAPATAPVYRCYLPGSSDHFITRDANCEGATSQKSLFANDFVKAPTLPW